MIVCGVVMVPEESIETTFPEGQQEGYNAEGVCVAREDVFRLPVIWLLGALAGVVGAFMGYIHMPLVERVEMLETQVHQADIQRAETRRDIHHYHPDTTP